MVLPSDNFEIQMVTNAILILRFEQNFLSGSQKKWNTHKPVLKFKLQYESGRSMVTWVSYWQSQGCAFNSYKELFIISFMYISIHMQYMCLYYYAIPTSKCVSRCWNKERMPLHWPSIISKNIKICAGLDIQGTAQGQVTTGYQGLPGEGGGISSIKYMYNKGPSHKYPRSMFSIFDRKLTIVGITVQFHQRLNNEKYEGTGTTSRVPAVGTMP